MCDGTTSCTLRLLSDLMNLLDLSMNGALISRKYSRSYVNDTSRTLMSLLGMGILISEFPIHSNIYDYLQCLFPETILAKTLFYNLGDLFLLGQKVYKYKMI